MAKTKRPWSRRERKRPPPGKLRELLSYDKETGVLAWLSKPPRSRVNVGDPAGYWITDPVSGCPSYNIVGVRGRTYGAHVLAFVIVEGYWPAEQIDHRDGNRRNNRWANLREATHGENQHNTPRSRNNKSGFKGVHKRKHGWEASIQARKKYHYLNTFKTAQEAHAAYCAAAERLFGEFASAW